MTSIADERDDTLEMEWGGSGDRDSEMCMECGDLADELDASGHCEKCHESRCRCGAIAVLNGDGQCKRCAARELAAEARYDEMKDGGHALQ